MPKSSLSSCFSVLQNFDPISKSLKHSLPLHFIHKHILQWHFIKLNAIGTFDVVLRFFLVPKSSAILIVLQLSSGFQHQFVTGETDAFLQRECCLPESSCILYSKLLPLCFLTLVTCNFHVVFPAY